MLIVGEKKYLRKTLTVEFSVSWPLEISMKKTLANSN